MSLWSRVKGWFGAAPPPEPEQESPAPREAPAPPPPPAQYVEPVLPVVRNTVLEAAIAEAPDATEPYLVYADWLQERGDPRGELIAIQHAIREVSEHAALASLKERERELFRKHTRHLAGPVIGTGMSERYHLGFIRHLYVWEPKAVPVLEALIAGDHPATRFLATVKVAEQLAPAARIRALLNEHGRPNVRLLSDDHDPVFVPGEVAWVEAAVECTQRGAGFEIHALLDVIVDDHPDHAYVARTTVESAGRSEQFWFGSGAALTEESLGDDQPTTGGVHVAELPATLAVELRLRIRTEAQTQTLWLAARFTVTEEGRTEVLFRSCEPRTGAPFEHSAVARVTPACGPTLVEGDTDDDDLAAELANKAGAVLPGAGVFVASTASLVTETGTESLAVTPGGDVWLRGAYGGANRALAVVHNRRGGRGGVTDAVLSLGRAGRALAAVELGMTVTGAFDERGDRFAVVMYSPGAVLVVLETDGGREVARAELPSSTEEAALGWHGGAPFVVADGACSTLDLATSTLATRAIPQAMGIGWRQYGAGHPSYHPTPDRIAWLICAAFPDEGLGTEGTTLISWRDGSGASGSVAVPDHGWAQDTARFGNVSVLEDGRIVAIGTRIWLVDDGRVSDLGPAGNYTLPPVIAGSRLYSQGLGPWWIELPPRER